ncbi:MAG TPA: hypothetical protein PKV62_07200, partial [Oscillospiraceae bacterium]|nr:hypothetical protein [Oscillospiraceae bacterium]
KAATSAAGTTGTTSKAAAATSGTGTSSGNNTANSSASSGTTTSKAAASGASASNGSGTANSAATSGNGTTASSAGELPDSLRKSLASYLKTGDWVPSYYRYASTGWRTNFESAAASYVQGGTFTEETRTGFVTGIFSDWGGKDTSAPIDQSSDKYIQGSGQTSSKAESSSAA